MIEKISSIQDSNEWICENMRKLETPVGSFCVSDGVNNLHFSICSNYMNYPYEVYDENIAVVGKIETKTNYRIAIPTANMIIGREYTISFSDGKWCLCDEDENTTCYDTVIDNWAVGIGAFDPNRQSKEYQRFDYEYKRKLGIGLERIFEYDESDFDYYTVDVLDDYSGYTFKLFDYSEEYIYFQVAWVEIKEYKPIEYEYALGIWLC